MTRATSHALFPVTTLAFAALTGVSFTMIGVEPVGAVALALALFAAILAIRNWWIGEEERPLLAEELLEIHEAVSAAERDRAELRESLQDLARIVERHVAARAAGAPEAPAQEGQAALDEMVERRLAALETATTRAAVAAAPEADAAEALRVIETRLAASEERARRLANAVTLALSETKRLGARLDAGDAGPPIALEPEAPPQIGPDPTFAADPGPAANAAEETAPPPAQAAAEPQTFEIKLQPIVSLADRRPRFFEAVADELGAADAEAATFLRGATVAARLRAAGRPATVFCPLSIEPLRSEAFVAAARSLLRKRADLSDRLAIEISQAELERASELDIELLQRIGALGVSFALTDVEDWSIDLEQLRLLGFKYVKLDQQRFSSRAGGADGVERLAGKLEELGLTLIVENIDDLAAAAALRAAGVAFGQGPAFGAASRVRVDAPDPARAGEPLRAAS
ncbi:MAG: EAL domain-containing protein [Pseudomonadota bacterium]